MLLIRNGQVPGLLLTENEYSNKTVTDSANGLINRIFEQTRQIKSLFYLKEKKHLRITRGLTGDCSCDANCIGEIMENVKLQIHGHSNPRNDLDPARYLDEK